MSDSLSKLEKSWVAAKASLNARYRPREGSEGNVSNTAIETDKIRTLAEYRGMNPEKLSTWNPERKDIDKLMEIYIIPIVLPTGEKIDLVVNQQGQDMACIYLDEESNTRSFHLTSRMQNELKKSMIGTDLLMDPKEIERLITPKTLEEFTELAAKDELVPKGPDDVKNRVKENRKIEKEEHEKDGMTIEEAAASTGIGKDILEKFADENGRIVGIRKTTDIEGLSQELDYELKGGSSEIILLRVSDGTADNKGYVLDKSGNIMYSSLDGRGNPEVLTDIVKTGSNGDRIENIDEAIKDSEAESREIEYTSFDSYTGTSKDVEYAQKGSESEIQGFERDAQTIIVALISEIEKIDSAEIENSERLQQKGDTYFQASQTLKHLQTAYGVIAPQKEEEFEALAKDCWANVDVEKAKETVKNVITGGNKDDDEDGYDERDPIFKRFGGGKQIFRQ